MMKTKNPWKRATIILLILLVVAILLG